MKTAREQLAAADLARVLAQVWEESTVFRPWLEAEFGRYDANQATRRISIGMVIVQGIIVLKHWRKMRPHWATPEHRKQLLGAARELVAQRDRDIHNEDDWAGCLANVMGATRIVGRLGGDATAEHRLKLQQSANLTARSVAVAGVGRERGRDIARWLMYAEVNKNPGIKQDEILSAILPPAPWKWDEDRPGKKWLKSELPRINRKRRKK